MSIDVRPCATLDELREALDAIGHYFGHQNDLDEAERVAKWIEVERVHAAWDAGRLVDAEEAARVFPPLYEELFAQRPGMFTRSTAWWETRRLAPSTWSKGGPKQFALLEFDGEPAGYAIYTVQQDWRAGSSSGTVNVVELVTPTPDATRELWRWMLHFDWTSQFRAGLMPLDYRLFLLLAAPRHMRVEV